MIVYAMHVMENNRLLFSITGIDDQGPKFNFGSVIGHTSLVKSQHSERSWTLVLRTNKCFHPITILAIAPGKESLLLILMYNFFFSSPLQIFLVKKN